MVYLFSSIANEPKDRRVISCGKSDPSGGVGNMYGLLKKRIIGTPFEPLARKVAKILRPAQSGISVGELNVLYDQQADLVMERVLDRQSNCIDVGCHAGSMLDVMLRLSPGGEFHAFEPLPHLFSALKVKYASMPNVHLHQAALSEEVGTASFQHVVTNPGYSGLRRRDYSRPDETIVEIQVDLRRLDDVVPDDFDVRLIKIDVEGAELQVLRGAMKTLARCRPYVIFEHGVGGSDHYGTRPETVYDLFATVNLRVSTMADWLAAPDRAGFSREEFMDQFDRGLNFYYLAHP
jgi:FkbM family methyltransferase